MSKAAGKTCRECKQTMPLSAFAHRKASKDGRQPVCKECSGWVPANLYGVEKHCELHAGIDDDAFCG